MDEPTRSRTKGEAPDLAVDVELTDEELQHVVGGLVRACVDSEAVGLQDRSSGDAGVD